MEPAGTPSSVFDLDGALATDAQAPSAVAAARGWLEQDEELFGLTSAADLTLVRDTPLADGGGHAVLLGQTFDGVLAAPDGLVTVAVTGSAAAGWDITPRRRWRATRRSAGDYALSPEHAQVPPCSRRARTGSRRCARSSSWPAIRPRARPAIRRCLLAGSRSSCRSPTRSSP
jgi:hypothetical protein